MCVCVCVWEGPGCDRWIKTSEYKRIRIENSYEFKTL